MKGLGLRGLQADGSPKVVPLIPLHQEKEIAGMFLFCSRLRIIELKLSPPSHAQVFDLKGKCFIFGQMHPPPSPLPSWMENKAIQMRKQRGDPPSTLSAGTRLPTEAHGI